MFEVFVLIEKKKSMLIKVLAVLFLVITVGTVLMIPVGGTLFYFAALVCGGMTYFLYTRNYEYEYSYFDGDVRFAKIINRNSRKQLQCYTMEEVITIAPIEDRSVHNYLQGEKAKVKDLSSGYDNVKVYALVVNTEKGIEVIKFEPDEKYLDAVCVKYTQKVIR